MQARFHTVNELVGDIAKRAGELALLRVAELRMMHPDNFGEEAPVQFRKDECIEAILYEEYSQVFDVQLAESVAVYREDPGNGSRGK